MDGLDRLVAPLPVNDPSLQQGGCKLKIEKAQETHPFWAWARTLIILFLHI